MSELASKRNNRNTLIAQFVSLVQKEDATKDLIVSQVASLSSLVTQRDEISQNGASEVMGLANSIIQSSNEINVLTSGLPKVLSSIDLAISILGRVFAHQPDEVRRRTTVDKEKLFSAQITLLEAFSDIALTDMVLGEGIRSYLHNNFRVVAMVHTRSASTNTHIEQQVPLTATELFYGRSANQSLELMVPPPKFTQSSKSDIRVSLSSFTTLTLGFLNP